MSQHERLEELANELEEAFGEIGCTLHRLRDELTLEVPRDRLGEVMRALHRGPAFQFEQCVDVCGVDYATYGNNLLAPFDCECGSSHCRGRVREDDHLQPFMDRYGSHISDWVRQKRTARSRVEDLATPAPWSP